MTTSRPSRSGALRSAIAAFCALASLACATALANFDSWGGKGYKLGPIKCNADGTLKPLTNAEKMMLQPLVDQLKKPLSTDAAKRYSKDAGLGLTDAQAWEKIDCMRMNAKLAQQLAQGMLSTQACKDWVKSQAEAGNICVGWGMSGAAATVNIDRESDKADCMAKKRASEAILIDADWILKGKLKAHESNALVLAEFIRHETTHAGQLYKPAAGTLPNNPTDAQKKAADGKTYAMNEIEAHGGGETWERAMKMAVCDANLVDPDVPLPANLNPAIKQVLESIRGIMDDTERATAIATLKAHMEHYANWNRDVKMCYEAAKMAFCNFLMDGDRDALKKVLADNKWKQWISWLDNPNFVAMLPPDRIDQQSYTGEAAAPTIHTGIIVRDFLVLLRPSGKRLLVIGEEPSGFGTLLAYSDPDNDGFFNQETRQVVFFNDPRLQDNMQLIFDPARDLIYAFDSFSRQFRRLVDAGTDGIPDFIAPSPVNPPFAELDDFQTYTLVAGAEFPALIGHNTIDSNAPATPDDELLPVLADLNSDGFFEQLIYLTHEQAEGMAPTFEHGTLVAGALSVAAYAPEFHPFQVWTTSDEGGLFELLGGAAGQGVSMFVKTPLSRPLIAGERVLILDQQNGAATFPHPVGTGLPPCPSDLDGDGATGAPDLAILLGSWGGPAGPADLNGDGIVGSADLALMLGSWGPCPDAFRTAPADFLTPMMGLPK